MNEQIDRLSLFFEKLKEYVTLQIDIISLSAGEKAANLLARLISNGTIVLLGVLTLIFGSFAGAFALGTWFNSYALGFLAIALFYFVIAVIVILCKDKYIERPLIDTFIKLFFKNNSGDKK